MTRLTILGIGPVAVRVDPVPAERIERVSLCRACVRAHIETGYEEGEERIFCTLGGWLRPLDFQVRACTSYIETRAGSEVGFAFSLDEEEQVAV